MNKKEIIRKKKMLIGKLKADRIRNRAKINCFSQVLSFIEDENNCIKKLKKYCETEISYNVIKNQNIEISVRSFFK